jgi:hypothetical protein
MGDLADLTNLPNTYLSISNVTKAYGLIQITYMVNIVASHFANNFSTKGGLIYKVHHHFPNPTRTFFFSPKSKISEDDTPPICNDFSIVPYGEYISL